MNIKINEQPVNGIKQTIRKYKKSKNTIVRLFIRALSKTWRLIQPVKVLWDANLRSVFFLKLLNSENVHQTTSLTYMDRYPEIFAACRDFFDGRKNLKILSYGCSTGEEVLTLHQYFPDAQIVGAEINKHSLAVCRNLPANDKITFVYSEFNELQKRGNFDAVFCMAVLQRTPHYIAAEEVRSLKKIYPFEKFERQIVELDGLLNLQGLLVIKFSQYSFLETAVASKYVPLDNHRFTDYVPYLFDKNSDLIRNPEAQEIIFVKIHA